MSNETVKEKQPKIKCQFIHLNEEGLNKLSDAEIREYAALTLQTIKKRYWLVNLVVVLPLPFPLLSALPYAFKTMKLKQGYEALSGEKFRPFFLNSLLVNALGFIWAAVLGLLMRLGFLKNRVGTVQIAIPKVK